ncbi:hypothetical protein MRB53_026110 [Persea americana]|uniref:Uncharacterized protein n=1 Tax=Persea americana TaxID=3435 RepID=A0ACC2LIB8_PERAE|nr:hypothetical protein MRB53_026110 [Persea americana]
MSSEVKRKQRRKCIMYHARDNFGFGCEIDEKTSNKLEGLPGVLFVLPNFYVDAENMDYGVVHLGTAEELS